MAEGNTAAESRASATTHSEVHVQGARAAPGAPVRNVTRRLAAYGLDWESGSQQRAAYSLTRLQVL